MAYVDLNPIRAKMATTPEESEFTSIYERIQYASHQLNNTSSISSSRANNDLPQPKDFMPFKDNSSSSEASSFYIEYHFSDYLELVDWTGRIIRHDKKGAIPSHLLPILERLQINISGWLAMTQELEERFFFKN